jgi:Nop14-like family
MAKRKAKAKRSLGSLPKGLPNKNSSMNPFEVIKRHKNVKIDVNKRPDQANASKFSESLLRRQIQHRAVLQSSKKVNSFVDRRIGELTMSHEEKTLARLVKERSGRSKRNLKYTLDDDVDLDVLTHRGQSIDHTNMSNHIILDSDEEDAGNLDAMDTEMNFGGLDTDPQTNPYGPLGGKHKDLMQTYTQKKNDLDEMIKRRKLMKAEKLMSKEQQAETFESLDQELRTRRKRRESYLKKKRKWLNGIKR